MLMKTKHLHIRRKDNRCTDALTRAAAFFNQPWRCPLFRPFVWRLRCLRISPTETMCASSSLLTALRAVNFGSVSSIKTRRPIHNYGALSLFDEALRQQSELSDWSWRCSNIVYVMGNKETPAQATQMGINKKWMKCECVCGGGVGLCVCVCVPELFTWKRKSVSLLDVHRRWRRIFTSECKFGLQHQELLLLATFVMNELINN